VSAWSREHGEDGEDWTFDATEHHGTLTRTFRRRGCMICVMQWMRERKTLSLRVMKR